MTLAPGTRLGPYEITSAIGRGGSGDVYRARDTRLDRVVAIKTLRADVAADPEHLRRFEREARAASALNHQNILTIYDVGREGQTDYIAMEWVEGDTLRDVMGGGRLPIRRLLRIAQQIADGLAQAHAAGIIHRDLKPANVMIGHEGLAKIVDFGLAKLASSPGVSREETHTAGTLPGMVMGTLGYMSPEQAGARPVDHRSDQFAFGAIVYEMATATQPFQRDTVVQTLAATIEDDPAPIRTLNPGVPERLATIVERCLAKDPNGRYDSTRDLARDLEQVVEGIGTVVTMQPARPARRRAKWLAAAAALAVLVAIAAVAGLSMREPAAGDRPLPPLVAVRAFRNLSSETSRDYFASGMTEEIRGQLSKMSALRLLSRTAVEKYAGGESSRMVTDLGVGGIVDGSVRLDGDRVRISVELVDARNDHTMWSEQYDREIADIFSVQSDVALHIARALQASLSPVERARVNRKPTENLDAYQLFLKSADAPDVATYRDLLHRAITLDPKFAAAKADLAYSLVFEHYAGDNQALDRAMTLAREGVENDPNLAAPHFVLGTGYTMRGQDSKARLAFMRALELDPSNTSAMSNLSMNELQFGRFDDSLLWARRMFLISERSANSYYHVSAPLLFLRDDEMARKWLAHAERQFPSSARIQLLLACSELLRGDGRASLARLRRAVERWPTDDEVARTLAEVAFLTRSDDAAVLTEKLATTAPDGVGNVIAEGVRVRRAHFLTRSDARRAAAEAAEVLRLARQELAAGSENPWTSINIAAALMVQGEREPAFDSLTAAVKRGYRDYGFLARDPIFEAIAPDPRFRALIDHMTNDVALQRQRAAERGLLDLGSLVPGLK